MDTDFTFKNKLILSFFNYEEVPAPVREIIYLHEHPLVKPNFIVELIELVEKTNNHLISKKISGHPIDEFTSIAIRIGQQLPKLTEENAPLVLEEFRKLYKICNQILSLK